MQVITKCGGISAITRDAEYSHRQICTDIRVSLRDIGIGGQTMRDRLIKLLNQSDPIMERIMDDEWYFGETEDIADYLLANGVTLRGGLNDR